MTSARHGYWVLLGIITLSAYGIVWQHAYAGKHALDPAMPEPRGSTVRVMVSYVFHPDDCPDATEFIDVLNELAAGGEQISGLMITHDADTTAVRGIASAYRIRFPVRPLSVRDAGLLLGALRHTRTPLAIVRDSTGAIRMVIPGKASVPTVEQLRTFLRSKPA